MLYHDGYSRPNKPVNELVSLEILKHLMGLSDAEFEHAYLFDFRVRNALGKESLGDNICPKTFTNFRRRLLEYEEETGRNLLDEVFTEHRDFLQDEFNIDASHQRMDSTLVDANIKELSRMDLIGKVVYNFLDGLPEDGRAAFRCAECLGGAEFVFPQETWSTSAGRNCRTPSPGGITS